MILIYDYVNSYIPPVITIGPLAFDDPSTYYGPTTFIPEPLEFEPSLALALDTLQDPVSAITHKYPAIPAPVPVTQVTVQTKIIKLHK